MDKLTQRPPEPCRIKHVRFFPVTMIQRLPEGRIPRHFQHDHSKGAEITLDWWEHNQYVSRRIYVTEMRGVQFMNQLDRRIR